MYLSINAIASAGASPIVRIPAAEPWIVKRALDAGAHGIMVPMVSTREQAEAIVSAVKYPSKAWPTGVRGIGTMFGPAIFGQDDRAYTQTANDNVSVIVQIETRTGLENCEEIVNVPGIGQSIRAGARPKHADVVHRLPFHWTQRPRVFLGLLCL